MGMKTFLASIGLAVGMGHAADAALYRYDVTFLETVYHEVALGVDHGPTDDRFEYTELSSKEDPWGLPRLWDGIQHGETYPFRAEIHDDRVASCTLGAYDCSITNDDYWSRVQTDPLKFSDEETWLYVTGRGGVGDRLEMWKSWYFLDPINMPEKGIFGITGDHSHHFEIARVLPVPLPLPAALLPLGLGALALQRRRNGNAGKDGREGGIH